MASQLSALRTSVQRMIGDERAARYAAALVNEIINDGMRELALITRNYNVATTLAVTAPGPTDLPSDFIALNRIELDDNPLWRLDYRQVKSYRNSTSTTPSFYVIRGSQIHLYPTPSANLTLDIDYIAVPAALSADGDTPDASLGHFADQFLKFYAARELTVIGQDFEASQHWAGQLGILEMRVREAANSDEMYESIQVYPAATMVNDDRGVDGWLT